MIRRNTIVALAITFGFIFFLVTAAPASDEDGKAVFENEKCGMCHSVSTVGIESKLKAGKLKGPDLVNLADSYEADWIFKYIKKEADKEGKSHTKPFKGSDEELQALVDWLLEQKAEG